MTTDTYIQQIKADLEEIREHLASLESGQLRLSAREGTAPWRDTTQDWIAQQRRTIAVYEAILAAEEKKPR